MLTTPTQVCVFVKVYYLTLRMWLYDVQERKKRDYCNYY